MGFHICGFHDGILSVCATSTNHISKLAKGLHTDQDTISWSPFFNPLVSDGPVMHFLMFYQVKLCILYFNFAEEHFSNQDSNLMRTNKEAFSYSELTPPSCHLWKLQTGGDGRFLQKLLSSNQHWWFLMAHWHLHVDKNIFRPDLNFESNLVSFWVLNWIMNWNY